MKTRTHGYKHGDGCRDRATGGGMLHGARCTDAGRTVHMKKAQEENLTTDPPYTAIQSSFWVFPQSYLNKDTQTN